MAQINLLQSLELLLQEPIVQQAPALLNESRTNVVNGLGAALSNVLGAIVHHANKPEGAASLLSALRMPNVDTNLLTQDLSGVFAGGTTTQELIDNGKSHLGLLFGHKVQGFNDALAQISGLTSKSSALLTGMVTPFVLAAIKRAATAAGPLEASSLGSVLNSQSMYLKGHLSESLLGALGFGGIASWLGGEVHRVSNKLHKMGEDAKDATMTTEQVVAKRKRMWTILGLALLALLALLSLGFCMKRTPDATEQPAAAASPGGASSASTMTDTIPKGAGILAAMIEGKPNLKIYFEYGKTDLPTDFTDKAKDVLAYLKDNPSSKVSLSGFTDASGDPALNAELAKKRAESVKAALLSAGVDESRISLDKPDMVSGSTSDAKDRRVEIRVQ